MDLVDTDVLIDVQRGHPPALAWFSSLTNLPAVPGVVVMELVQDARNPHEVRQALRLLTPRRVVWPTEVDCGSGTLRFRFLPFIASPRPSRCVDRRMRSGALRNFIHV